MAQGQPVPQEVMDRARRLCDVYPQRVAAELVGLSTMTLRRAKHSGWKATNPGPGFRPPPNDFEVMAKRGHSYADLAAYYRASLSAISRWKREIGLPVRSRRGGGR
jgi:hypothetical protein